MLHETKNYFFKKLNASLPHTFKLYTAPPHCRQQNKLRIWREKTIWAWNGSTDKVEYQIEQIFAIKKSLIHFYLVDESNSVFKFKCGIGAELERRNLSELIPLRCIYIMQFNYAELCALCISVSLSSARLERLFLILFLCKI